MYYCIYQVCLNLYNENTNKHHKSTNNHFSSSGRISPKDYLHYFYKFKTLNITIYTQINMIIPPLNANKWLKITNYITKRCHIFTTSIDTLIKVIALY